MRRLMSPLRFEASPACGTIPSPPPPSSGSSPAPGCDSASPSADARKEALSAYSTDLREARDSWPEDAALDAIAISLRAATASKLRRVINELA